MGDFDYLLIGGGLQSGLIALAVRVYHPEARIAIVERGDRIGGNHTWCFHAGDVSSAVAAWIDPLVVARWRGYDVRFADSARRVDLAYACIPSDRFALHVAAALELPGSALLCATTVLTASAHSVLVRERGGATRELTADVVIDARGPDRLVHGRSGWQKFVGQELELTAPHDLERPILIDATVEQRDGFQFAYVLPLDARRVLVEDTSFSDGTHLDVAACRTAIAAYVAGRDWRIATVVREESGVLPMPWQCDPPKISAPLVSGYAGGWFHPVTGYSLPIAARLAERIAQTPRAELYGDGLASLVRDQTRQLRFAVRLNKMMFGWFPPARRHHVLERFYQLDDATIARFYALALTPRDRVRMLFGCPPRGLSLRAVIGLEAT